MSSKTLLTAAVYAGLALAIFVFNQSKVDLRTRRDTENVWSVRRSVFVRTVSKEREGRHEKKRRFRPVLKIL
jgi:hypothetical protein